MTQSPVIMEENVLVPLPSHVNVLQAGLVPIVELVSVELNLLYKAFIGTAFNVIFRLTNTAFSYQLCD